MADSAGKKKKSKPAAETKPAVEAKPAAEAKAVEKKPKKVTALKKHKFLLKKCEAKYNVRHKSEVEIRKAQREQERTPLTPKEKKAIIQKVRGEFQKPLKARPHPEKFESAEKRLAHKAEQARKKGPGEYNYPSKKNKRIKQKADRKAKWATLTNEQKSACRKPVHKDSFKKCGRLYVYSVFTGYKRGLRNQHENTALLKVEGCRNALDARWYAGKKAAFVYKAKRKTVVPNRPYKKSIRVIWGKVTRPHGHTGKVRAKFTKNLPSTALGKKIRIMLYPSAI